MKIVGVIPARYASTRFPGKPLADICGKPMIWWVYQQAIQVGTIDKVYVLTDDDRIVQACKLLDLEYLLTDSNHANHIERVYEASTKIEADFFICINGDEPLIKPENIAKVIPQKTFDSPYFCGATRRLTDAADIIDINNIKLILNPSSECVYMSRAAIPYPKLTSNFSYYKYVGIECFNKMSLELFHRKDAGKYEMIEDIDHIRFIENGVKLNFVEVESESISVDTKKDLQYAIRVISGNLEGSDYE